MSEKKQPQKQVETLNVNELMAKLTAPFPRDAVRFKPAVVSGNRAMAIAYVDARVIQDRLDEVLGVLNWQDEYEFLEDGSVVCRLKLRIDNEWITKMDVGGPSEQPDEGDRKKAAVSDALKRAAVKFGIGRYLYRLPTTWVEYDPKKKRIVKPPVLPGEGPSSSTVPETKTAPKPAPRPMLRKEPPAKPASAMPATGEELQERLYAYDKRLAVEGVCEAGELVKFVVEAGKQKGYEGDLATWSGDAIKLAIEQTKAFEAHKRKKPSHQPQKVA